MRARDNCRVLHAATCEARVGFYEKLKKYISFLKKNKLKVQEKLLIRIWLLNMRYSMAGRIQL